eukprot:g25752.t1
MLVLPSIKFPVCLWHRCLLFLCLSVHFDQVIDGLEQGNVSSLELSKCLVSRSSPCAKDLEHFFLNRLQGNVSDVLTRLCSRVLLGKRDLTE